MSKCGGESSYPGQLSQYVNFYRPQRSCGQGNIFTPVCHPVHRGGGSPAGRTPPRPGRTPPGPGRTPPLRLGRPLPGTRENHPPPDQGEPTHPPGTRENPPPTPGRNRGPGRTPPRDQGDPPDQGEPPPGSRLQHTVCERPVRILLECILVVFFFCRTGGTWTTCLSSHTIYEEVRLFPRQQSNFWNHALDNYSRNKFVVKH